MPESSRTGCATISRHVPDPLGSVLRRRGCSPSHVAFCLSLGFLIASCADPNPVDENPIRSHPPEWNKVGSPDFHGDRVAREGPESCTACHGDDLRGDAVAPSCYDCHDGPGGHPNTWVSPPDPFHGTQVQLTGPTSCGECHGADYRGGWSGVSCYTCHAGGPSGHPEGWLTRGAPTFHGLEVALHGNLDCRRCHGNDLMGGTSGVACADCHVPEHE